MLQKLLFLLTILSFQACSVASSEVDMVDDPVVYTISDADQKCIDDAAKEVELIIVELESSSE